MEQEFINYTSNYDMEKKGIKLKFAHSFRVMKVSMQIAEALNLDDEDKELAKLIGLLHDFGRFEQLKVYNTYDDHKSIDHADYSAEQLFDKGQIINYYKNSKNYPIIEKAIRNHNKFSITDVNDERTMMHCKLIRDTDKIDILYNMAELGEINLNEDGQPISEKVLNDFKNHKSINHLDLQNRSDRLTSCFAFIRSEERRVGKECSD